MTKMNSFDAIFDKIIGKQKPKRSNITNNLFNPNMKQMISNQSNMFGRTSRLFGNFNLQPDRRSVNMKKFPNYNLSEKELKKLTPVEQVSYYDERYRIASTLADSDEDEDISESPEAIEKFGGYINPDSEYNNLDRAHTKASNYFKRNPKATPDELKEYINDIGEEDIASTSGMKKNILPLLHTKAGQQINYNKDPKVINNLIKHSEYMFYEDDLYKELQKNRPDILQQLEKEKPELYNELKRKAMAHR
jgi:hypothetical protein